MLTSYDGSAVTHDALGNILSFNGYTYTWQAGRRLAGMTNGTNTYGYKYDDNGVRTEKTVNDITTHYLTVDGRITGQYDGTDTLYFRYNADNSPIGFSLNGEEYLYLMPAEQFKSTLTRAYWCKLLNCSGARFLRNFAKKPCTLKRITFRFFLKSGDNQWILTVKTKVLTHKIEILTRFYIIVFANCIC